ncbi:ArgS-related anticodon-binding protein NrtL [Streptomyces sp. NPDC101393]|uniref:ArgS-related anticodon-binding protein NrtL n=1 Tax=Streptomyces sp. NPDC101393 TaxID=3366141 RepID=UPI003800ECAA
MTPAELSRTVLRSVRGAVEEKELSVPVPARIVVRPAPRAGRGDFASNVALQLAGPAGRPAREVAEILRKRLVGSAGITRVEIAGPGFLNFTLGDAAQAALVREVLAQGDAYGAPSGSAGASAGEHRQGPERPEAPGPADAAAPCPLAAARSVVVRAAMSRILADTDTDTASAITAGAAPAASTAAAGWSDPDPVDVGDRELARLGARLGADEARWALLRPAARDAVRLPERPVQRESNPRFRVQYAYARTRALLRNAADLGFESEPGEVGAAGAEAAALHTALATYPAVVDAAARHRAPDRLVRHLETTADAFFRWHDGCPPLPVGEQKPLAVHRARLALAEATGTVLANGLRLLGISAPEHV